MGASTFVIPGAFKVLQTKNILRGSSEPRGIASYLFFRTAVRLQNRSTFGRRRDCDERINC